MFQTFQLSSGQTCQLVRPKNPSIPGYRVLYYPEHLGDPTREEQHEMLALALDQAQDCSRQRFGHPDNYMIIHNGATVRRVRGYHYHLVPVAGKVGKTWFYLVLFLKNIGHHLWLLARPHRRRNRTQ